MEPNTPKISRRGRPKKFTEEEAKARKAKYILKWYHQNREQELEKRKQKRLEVKQKLKRLEELEKVN